MVIEQGNTPRLRKHNIWKTAFIAANAIDLGETLFALTHVKGAYEELGTQFSLFGSPLLGLATGKIALTAGYVGMSYFFEFLERKAYKDDAKSGVLVSKVASAGLWLLAAPVFAVCYDNANTLLYAAHMGLIH